MLHICHVRRPEFYSGSFAKHPGHTTEAVFKALEEEGLCFLDIRCTVELRRGRAASGAGRAPAARGLTFRGDICAP